MGQTTLTETYLDFETYLARTDKTDGRYELVNGVLVDMPPESEENNDIARMLLFELAKHFPAQLIGHKDTEIEVSGQRATCRIPDLLVHTEASKAAVTAASRATITRDMPPPALVVEVVSPGQANRDRDYRYKHTEYGARGVAEYWIVDPEMQRVTVCLWVNGCFEDTVYTGTESIESTIAEKFALTSAEIFA